MPLNSNALEIREDQPFQEKVWIAQRIGWGGLLIFILLAVLGLTGPSHFTRKIEEKGGFRLEYPRFGRLGASHEIVFRGPSGEIFFSREIMRKTEVETAMPSPLRSLTQPEGMLFQFENAGGGEVHLDAKPREAGWVKGSVRMGSPPVEVPFKQFVYF